MTPFAARNREVGWVSFSISRGHIATQERSKSKVLPSSWETSSFSTTFSGVAPLSWGMLPIDRSAWTIKKIS